MENLQLLFSKNKSANKAKLKVIDGYFTYNHTSSEFGNSDINNLISFFNFLSNNYPNQKLSVKIDLKQTFIHDKLTYILIECICKYMMDTYGYKVIFCHDYTRHIHTDGLSSSPLLLLASGKDINQKRFLTNFSFDIYNTHFRRVFTKKQLCENDTLCKILDDISNFQKSFSIEPEWRETISEVFVELLGNAGEHAHSACLVDFDVTPDYAKKGSEGKFVGVNIVVLNFSEMLLGSSLKDKITSIIPSDNRYGLVCNAYEKHKDFFNEYYTEEDFFSITAFQHKISGRKDNNTTGGTGLTKLINSLEAKSDANMCYLMTGQRRLMFKQEYLNYNSDGWLGFNDSNDYFGECPNIALIGNNSFYMPGSAYNLNFVFQREE